MKHLKNLGLAAVVACGLMAWAGAGGASATVLCKVAATPCGAANHADTISMSLAGFSVYENNSGTIINTCLDSELHLAKVVTGSATETFTGAASQEGFTTAECARPTTVLAGGTLEMHHIAGTGNGTVTGKGFEVTFLIAGAFSPCTYRLPEVTDVGVLEGGLTPRLVINTPIQGTTLLCPPFRWTATYHATNPTPLYVEPS